MTNTVPTCRPTRPTASRAWLRSAASRTVSRTPRSSARCARAGRGRRSPRRSASRARPCTRNTPSGCPAPSTGNPGVRTIREETRAAWSSMPRRWRRRSSARRRSRPSIPRSHSPLRATRRASCSPRTGSTATGVCAALERETERSLAAVGVGIGEYGAAGAADRAASQPAVRRLLEARFGARGQGGVRSPRRLRGRDAPADRHPARRCRDGAAGARRGRRRSRGATHARRAAARLTPARRSGP